MHAKTEIEKKLKESAKAVNAALEEYLDMGDPDCAVLCESMRYSSLSGGKRVRAFLALEFFSLFGGQGADAALPIACAIEMIHTYSLIHDDLPCMDDDDFRRGQPSNHKKFGEAVALLAGDALLTLAFGIIADAKFLPDDKKIRLISEIAQAAGHKGMVGGQAMDMGGIGKNIEMATLVKTHMLKTGSMIAVSAKAGCIAGGASEEQIEMAADYAKNIGLAFQIIDDMLDKDDGAGNNFVNICGGGEAAYEYAARLTGEALTSLDELKKKNIDTKNLENLAKYLLERRN